MKTHLTRRIPIAVATGLALATLALGFLAALGVRSLVTGTASAQPVAPNPGHLWSEVEGHGIDGGDYWLGTSGNEALELHVNNERALRLEPDATSPNVIGGYSGNSVTSGAYAATIGGGGESGYINQVTNNYGTIGGGLHNTASGYDGTVGGGEYNTAAGSATVGGGSENSASNAYAAVGGGNGNAASGNGATIGGGYYNTASASGATVGGGRFNSASGLLATVGGGWSNTASNDRATVGGGGDNTATGLLATVPGGYLNSAQGNFSFAAGWWAKANHLGAFVWADYNGFPFPSTASNQFSARTTGGARFVSAIDGSGTPTAGVTLPPGGNAWSGISDRNVKANFASVDGQDILDRLASIPIETWNLKAQDASIRHMGPVAQDFYAAFALGESDTSISTVDADGVALAAIQGLYQLSQEQAARIQALEDDNATLQQRLDDLEARVSALERGVGVNEASSGPLSSGLPATWLLLGGLVLLALVLVRAAVRRRFWR